MKSKTKFTYSDISICTTQYNVGNFMNKKHIDKQPLKNTYTDI